MTRFAGRTCAGLFLASALHGCATTERPARGGGETLVWRFLDPALACDEGGNVYVSGAEQFGSHTQIFLASSNRYGSTWKPRFHYLNHSRDGDRGRPQLSTGATGEVYVLWEDTRDGPVHLYFNRSLDGGATWLPADLRINTGTGSPSRVSVPALASDRQANVHVVWRDEREGFEAFYANRSRDRGKHWLRSDVRITSVGLGRKSAPRVVCDQQAGLYVAWVEQQAGDLAVLFNASNNHGESWMIQDHRLSARGVARLQLPSLCALESGIVLVSWMELRNGRAEIMLARSTDRGRSWESPSRPLRAHGGGLFNPSGPQILCDRFEHVYVAWQALTADRGTVIILKSSVDGGRSFSETRFSRTDAAGIIGVPRLEDPGVEPFRMYADDAGNVYFAWIEEVAGTARIGFDRVSNHGTTWLGLAHAVDLSGHPPLTIEPPLLCADDFGHVYMLWNEGRMLTAAASPFYGDSGWRYEHF
ncbi:MAG: sialidase family protein [Candidatus Krumholzibacteriia bacterium]